MAHYTQERFNAVPIGANSSVKVTSQNIGGFLCKTAGTLTVVDALGVTIVDAIAVSAGVWTPLPFYLKGNGATVTTAGGAVGTLAA